MNSTPIFAAPPARHYPWLGTPTHTEKPRRYVVLFHAPGKGVVVATEHSGSYLMGHYYDAWAMDRFTRFEGTVTLTETQA